MKKVKTTKSTFEVLGTSPDQVTAHAAELSNETLVQCKSTGNRTQITLKGPHHQVAETKTHIQRMTAA